MTSESVLITVMGDSAGKLGQTQLVLDCCSWKARVL